MNNRLVLSHVGENVNVRCLTTREVLDLRQKLAKRINQRMLRLEKAGFTEKQGGAYADYLDILNRFYGGKKRIPENRNIFKSRPESEVKAMQALLKEKTSTVQGWYEVLEKRKKKLSEYGIEFKDTTEMSLFFKSYAFDLISRLYSSKQAISFVGKSLRESDASDIKEILLKLEEFRGRTDPDLADDVARSLGFKGEIDALKYKR